MKKIPMNKIQTSSISLLLVLVILLSGCVSDTERDPLHITIDHGELPHGDELLSVILELEMADILDFINTSAHIYAFQGFPNDTGAFIPNITQYVVVAEEYWDANSKGFYEGALNIYTYGKRFTTNHSIQWLCESTIPRVPCFGYSFINYYSRNSTSNTTIYHFPHEGNFSDDLQNAYLTEEVWIVWFKADFRMFYGVSLFKGSYQYSFIQTYIVDVATHQILLVSAATHNPHGD